ncbi:MAG: DMT family transporter [Archangium sp.]
MNAPIEDPVLKQTEGFSKLSSAITIVRDATAFFFLSLTLTELPTGFVNAVWSGVGVALIIAGVVLMNVFSKTSAH